jgi:hypothetical protein
MSQVDALCSAVRSGNFGVTMCEQEKMLALSVGTRFVNTPRFPDMEKMEGCLTEIKEQNESLGFVAGEQRFWSAGGCQ